MTCIRYFVIQLSVALLLLPTTLYAQDQRFRVVLRDVSGVGIPGATIRIADTDGQTLTSTTTNSTGEAFFYTLETSLIRVVVRGFLADGTPLHQLGDDEAGILFINDTPGLSLDLRVESDGSVLPDPSTMIALETSQSVELAIPEAPLPLPQTQPQNAVIAAGQPNDSAPDIGAVVAADQAGSGANILVFVMFGFITTLFGIALWMRRRGLL